MNDNTPPPPRTRFAGTVPIIGTVGDDGRVTITDPDWRPSPRPAPRLLLVDGDGQPQS